MTTLEDGKIFAVSRIQNGEKFLYRGKEIVFQKSEQDPSGNLWTAQTNLSKEELAAGNRNVAFTFNVGAAEGTLSVVTLPPETPEFKDLNDAQKLTKVNSIEYQFGTEPTDRGDNLDTILQNSYTNSTAKAAQEGTAAPKPVITPVVNVNAKKGSEAEEIKKQAESKKSDSK